VRPALGGPSHGFSAVFIEASFLRVKDRFTTRPQRGPASGLDDEGSFLQIAMQAQKRKKLAALRAAAIHRSLFVFEPHPPIQYTY
jgi:hypothetical protein